MSQSTIECEVPGLADSLRREEFAGASEQTSGYQVASTLEEAIASWRLVYRVYLESGLIERNPFGIHTCPQIVNSRSLVVQKHVQGRLVATLSALADDRHGLPLDSVFHSELQTLRRNDCTLMEVGQFAHDRSRTLGGAVPSVEDLRLELRMAQSALTILTGYTFQYGLGMGVTDIVIGVHPRHSRFYMRSWGFVPCSDERVYPMVNNRPVVLMRLDWRSHFGAAEPPYAIQYALEHPLPNEIFAHRYHFNEADLAMADVPVLDYLAAKYDVQKQAA